mmetsp:Transcript_14220/g.28264  ORF Transcript_14220/g.28264 Transcript_14220/m.28264 type:complete len:205 (-) Transcript_14220:310-924(-)
MVEDASQSSRPPHSTIDMSGYNTFVTGNNDDNNNNHAANTTTTAAAATTSSSSPLIPNELRHRRRSASHTTSSLGSDSNRSQSNNLSLPVPWSRRSFCPRWWSTSPLSAGIAEVEPLLSSGAQPLLRDLSVSNAFEQPISRSLCGAAPASSSAAGLAVWSPPVPPHSVGLLRRPAQPLAQRALRQRWPASAPPVHLPRPHYRQD